MSRPIVETDRVRLRPVQLADLPVFRAWHTPDAAWRALDGPYYPRPDEAGIDRMIEQRAAWIEAGHQPDPLRWVAIADRSTDRFIGHVSRYWIGQETNWPAIGIVLFDPACWGRGLGFEALGSWVDVLFREHPEIVRLDLRTWSGNTGMMRLALKLGFQLEACFRKARIVDGEHYDGLGYGLLREEWSPRG